MITIKEQANFKARDFFNYLDRQLTQAIKKARSNDLLVKIAVGTTYQQRNVKAEITEYEFGKKYVSVFKSPKIDVKIGYYLTDTPQGCQIVFKENVNLISIISIGLIVIGVVLLNVFGESH